MSLLLWGLGWIVVACLLALLVSKAICRADALDARRRSSRAAQAHSDTSL